MAYTVLSIFFWVIVVVIGYSCVGYVLLSLLAGWLAGSRRNSAKVDSFPSVSLIIPVYNEGTILREKLLNAIALDYPKDRLEILIADDHSTDETPQVVASFVSDTIRYIRFDQRRGKAATVSDAVRMSDGEILFLCDANVYFSNLALRKLTVHLADPDVGAVSGQVVLRSEESDFGVGELVYYFLERLVQISESRIGSMIGVDGGMYIVRRELFPCLPTDTLLDDFVVSMNVLRQGKRIVYEPAAQATESGTPTAYQEFRRRKRLAAGSVQSILRRHLPPWNRPVIMWQYVSHKLLRWHLPWLLLALLILNGALLRQGHTYSFVMGIQLAFYGLAALGALSGTLRRTTLFGVPFYFALGNAAIAVGTFRGLLRRETATWTPVARKPAIAKS